MSIEIQGLDKLVKRYGIWQAYSIVEPAVRRGAMRNQVTMATYPPVPAGSSYRRKGTLGRRWTTKTYNTGEAIYGVTGNNVHYAPRVQDSQRQKPVFKRIGWPTDADAVEKNRKAITDDIRGVILEALRK